MSEEFNAGIETEEQVEPECCETGVIEVTAKLQSGDEATVPYNFGTDLDDMVEKFGRDIVFTNARSNMKIALQGQIRRRLTAKQPCDDLATSWKPGQIAERIVDPVAAAKNHMAKLSDEEREAFIASLMAG